MTYRPPPSPPPSPSSWKIRRREEKRRRDREARQKRKECQRKWDALRPVEKLKIMYRYDKRKLRELATQYQIKGRSKLKREEQLLEALEEHVMASDFPEHPPKYFGVFHAADARGLSRRS